MNCIICERNLPLTRHHLVPVSRHKNKKTIKRHGKDQLQSTIDVCRECHNQLHATLTEKQMDEDYWSLQLLLNHPEIAKFTKWIRSHKPQGKVKVKRNNAKKRR